MSISNNKILQKSDDQYAKESGSMQAFQITPISEDSPNNVVNVNKGEAVQKTIEPKNKGTRDGHYDVVNDKDKNLRSQFVKQGL